MDRGIRLRLAPRTSQDRIRPIDRPIRAVAEPMGGRDGARVRYERSESTRGDRHERVIAPPFEHRCPVLVEAPLMAKVPFLASVEPIRTYRVKGEFRVRCINPVQRGLLGVASFACFQASVDPSGYCARSIIGQAGHVQQVNKDRVDPSWCNRRGKVRLALPSGAGRSAGDRM